MHEYAIASDIVGTIRTNYSEHYKSLTAINISIGKFSGIVTDSLDFGIEAILKEDGIDNVKIVFSEAIAEAECECGHKYKVENMFGQCPKCKSSIRKMLSGDGVIIETIEFDKEEEKT